MAHRFFCQVPTTRPDWESSLLLPQVPYEHGEGLKNTSGTQMIKLNVLLPKVIDRLVRKSAFFNFILYFLENLLLNSSVAPPQRLFLLHLHKPVYD